MKPVAFLDGRVTLYPGDCLDVLASLPENSVDSVVVDPPYHLTSGNAKYDLALTGAGNPRVRRATAGGGFMGKTWDGGDIAFQPATWAAVLRVLKPGGHLLAFSATRSYHRMAVAIEDGGFEVRDCIMWVYGSGFPKSHDISKAIDRMAGAEREVVGFDAEKYRPNRVNRGMVNSAGGSGFHADNGATITAPATDDARQWQGFGTALKPAVEPICVARKPLSESSIAANVLKHGTGGLNIDGCRVPGELDGDPNRFAKTDGGWGVKRFNEAPTVRGEGRWPANLIHDGSGEVLAGFPETGINGRPNSAGQQYSKAADVYGEYAPQEYAGGYLDSGSAARFFYTAKADAGDRIGSAHPTVKPLDLMQYLVRLVTPPGGTCLDCFAGTGSTGEAAWREGFHAILIEREPEYQADIARRMDLAVKPTKRAAVAKTKNDLRGAEGTPLFGDFAA